MQSYIEDIICAQATPHGVGAISIVRVSGKGSLELFSKILKKEKKFFSSHVSTYHKVYDEDVFLDEVLVSYFEEGRSFTGEESFEVSTHGSPLIVSSFLKFFTKNGARLAEPGEFSFRAYSNGKIDLSKAEGIHYTIKAQSELSKKLSLNLLEGRFQKEILQIKENLVWAASRVEASIDFSDQDIDLNHDKEVFTKINTARNLVENFLKSYDVGSVQAKGISVVLCGPPNAGKSTLFNSLLNEERSIVAEEAGTTRDYISQAFSIEGHPIQLIDTAGLRETQNQIESEGIERSVELAKKAQLILFLVSEDSYDESDSFFSKIKALNVPILVVDTKQDLKPWKSHLMERTLAFSSFSKESLSDLKIAVADELTPYFKLDSHLFIDRHHLLLQEAQASLIQLGDFQEISGAEDVISSLLYTSIGFVDEILYIEDPEAVRDKIFKDFCLGK